MSKEKFLYIYDDIINNTNQTLSSIEQSVENIDDKESEKQINIVIQSLKDVKNSISKSINELKENSNWDNYTIAFYGETNAGKSTIIETLRILLKEQKKLKEQSDFLRIQAQISNLTDANKVADVEKQISDEKKKNIETQVLEIKANKQKTFLDLREERKKLNDTIRINIWKVQVFKVLKCLKDKKEAKRDLKNKKNSRCKQLQEYNKKLLFKKNEIIELDKEFRTIESQKQMRNNAIEKNKLEIQDVSDGCIIGNGSRDYTVKTSRYDFDNFFILDMPGIQGNEKKVQEEIKFALQQSHIVFYVTKSPTPPQSGDGQTLGTIEKIKQHLGDQTQVYAIYNKPVQNPLSLDDNLIENKHGALTEMDNAFKSILGENYCGHIAISGLPAFCACSQYFHDDKFKTVKEKFLDKFSYDELLEKSSIRKFMLLLQNEIINNSHLKIIVANKNKISKNLDDIISNIKQQESNMDNFYDNIKKYAQNAQNAMRENFDGTKKDINNVFSDAARELKNNIRKSAYDFIETDVSNKELQDKINAITKKYIKNISEKINAETTLVFTEYTKNVKEDLKRFERYINDLEAVFDFNAKNDINCEIKTKSGIKIPRLIGGGVGIVLGTFTLVNCWNPAGWTAAMTFAALMILSGLIALIKSVWGVFSTSYRMSEQRKSVNTLLVNIGKSFQENTSRNKKEIIKQVEGQSNNIITNIDRMTDNFGKNLKLINFFIKSLQKIKNAV